MLEQNDFLALVHEFEAYYRTNIGHIDLTSDEALGRHGLAATPTLSSDEYESDRLITH